MSAEVSEWMREAAEEIFDRRNAEVREVLTSRDMAEIIARHCPIVETRDEVYQRALREKQQDLQLQYANRPSAAAPTYVDGSSLPMDLKAAQLKAAESALASAAPAPTRDVLLAKLTALSFVLTGNDAAWMHRTAQGMADSYKRALAESTPPPVYNQAQPMQGAIPSINDAVAYRQAEEFRRKAEWEERQGAVPPSTPPQEEGK